jgi:hypothetical protein
MPNVINSDVTIIALPAVSKLVVILVFSLNHMEATYTSLGMTHEPSVTDLI